MTRPLRPVLAGICLAGLCLVGLAACTTVAQPLPGTPEYAAFQVSRGYDCGLRVDRAAVLSRLDRDDRPRFLAASTSYAVKAYKAPRRCESSERAAVQYELSLLTKR